VAEKRLLDIVQRNYVTVTLGPMYIHVSLSYDTTLRRLHYAKANLITDDLLQRRSSASNSQRKVARHTAVSIVAKSTYKNFQKHTGSHLQLPVYSNTSR